jgi:hypothetical protein
MNKPKDSLFFKYVPRVASLGDLGPGYPVFHYAGEPTRLTQVLMKFCILGSDISVFDRSLTAAYNKLPKKFLRVVACLRTR